MLHTILILWIFKLFTSGTVIFRKSGQKPILTKTIVGAVVPVDRLVRYAAALADCSEEFSTVKENTILFINNTPTATSRQMEFLTVVAICSLQSPSRALGQVIGHECVKLRSI